MAFNSTQVTLDARAVTPADATVVNFFGLYVGGYASGTTPGNVVVVTMAGTTTTFANVPPGTILPIAVKAVNTATTATSIVGFGPT